jgi:hypothetical protein
VWTAALREASRMHTPFDEEWFASLLAARAAPPLAPSASGLKPSPGKAAASHRVERHEDWGEAPDTAEFVGRVDELALLRRWILEERCRLVAVLGVGGVAKTSLAAKLAGSATPGPYRRCSRGCIQRKRTDHRQRRQGRNTPDMGRAQPAEPLAHGH